MNRTRPMAARLKMHFSSPIASKLLIKQSYAIIIIIYLPHIVTILKKQWGDPQQKPPGL